MCAITCSFDKNTLLELIELNSYRGSHSYSFSTIDPVKGLQLVAQGLGTIDPSVIQIPEKNYAIVHIQAPTTEAKTDSNIHPAVHGRSRLWHNGIIKSHYVKTLQKKFGSDTEWDTSLMLRAISKSKEEINNFDGSFSCLWYDGSDTFLFRNDISPMFFDGDLNISSTKFGVSASTPSNCILKMDFAKKCLYNTGFEFRTVENPYYFGDDA